MHLGMARFVTTLLILLTIFCSRAFPDMSTARVGAGGITFTKSKDIRMLDEVLEISQKTIRVKFRFRNESDQDIATTVAFPVAPYAWRAGDYKEASLMETFKAWVDDRPVPLRRMRKVVLDDRDVTDQLRDLGLSEEDIFGASSLTEDQGEAVDKLVEGKWNDLKISDTALWEQTFPSGKEIVATFSYTPVAGGNYGCIYDKDRGYVSPDGQKAYSYVPIHEWITDWERNHAKPCMDQQTKRAIAKSISDLVAKGADSVDFNIEDIEYVLGTGRNWKGPIGTFTLRVEKETPDEFISLCFPGKPKKISPTVYEFHKKDFVPPDNLVVYFYILRPGMDQGENK